MKLTKYNDLLKDGSVIKGSWRLTPSHTLEFYSQENQKNVKLRTELFGVESNSIIASYTEKDPDGKRITGLLKLQGVWRTDEKNRLVFDISREHGKVDVLTLRGGWRFGKANELIYSYERTQLKTKKKKIQELIFSGIWELSEKKSLTYRLGVGSDSFFNFKGAFQAKETLASDNLLKYRAGFELSGKRRIQTIILFGQWQLSGKTGLLFEITYRNGRKTAIAFGAEYNISDQDKVAVELKLNTGKPLGLEVIFTKDFFKKDADAFLRFKRSVEESRVEAGVRIRW